MNDERLAPMAARTAHLTPLDTSAASERFRATHTPHAGRVESRFKDCTALAACHPLPTLEVTPSQPKARMGIELLPATITANRLDPESMEQRLGSAVRIPRPVIWGELVTNSCCQ